MILFLDEMYNPATGVGTGTRAVCGKSMLGNVYFLISLFLPLTIHNIGPTNAIIEMIIHSTLEPLKSLLKILMMAENVVITDQKHTTIKRRIKLGSICSNVA